MDNATHNSLHDHKAADGHITAALAPSEQSDAALQKRVAPVVIVIGIAAVKGTAIVTKIAIEIASDTIKNLGEWNKASDARHSLARHNR